MINRSKFFVTAARLFGGKLTVDQTAGIDQILDEWELRKLTDTRMLAYMLATAKWETNATMRAVREAYWLSEKWRRTNLRYYPYYGRGLPQLTWERNYRVMTDLLKSRFEKKYPDFNLVKTPDLALEPDVAIAIMFEGMLRGDFTGRALGDYFTPTKANWVGARAIINGTDRAAEIAEIALDFYAALGGVPEVRLLWYGSSGLDVAALQRALGLVDDGDFGPATREAVMSVQRQHGLSPDGVVGAQTRAVLQL